MIPLSRCFFFFILEVYSIPIADFDSRYSKTQNDTSRGACYKFLASPGSLLSLSGGQQLLFLAQAPF